MTKRELRIRLLNRRKDPLDTPHNAKYKLYLAQAEYKKHVVKHSMMTNNKLLFTTGTILFLGIPSISYLVNQIFNEFSKIEPFDMNLILLALAFSLLKFAIVIFGTVLVSAQIVDFVFSFLPSYRESTKGMEVHQNNVELLKLELEAGNGKQSERENVT